MWLIPIMGSILQDQGTNIRAMYHHILQCREGGTLDPKLNETTVRGIVDRVINENWLQLVSEKELEELAKCALKPGPQKLKSLLDSRSSVEGDILLWNFAGLIIQSGEWRTFHSYEEAWSLLASFWGMQAPLIVPTCTTWPALSDADSPVRQGMHLRYTCIWIRQGMQGGLYQVALMRGLPTRLHLHNPEDHKSAWRLWSL